MQRWTLLLVVVLASQLGLAGVLWLGAGQAGPPKPEALLSLDQQAIKTIRIASGPDDAGVELKREDDGWQLPASDGFPAKQRKAEDLARNLAGIEAGLPVAGSEAAFGRFNLRADQVERRIVINEGRSDSVTLLIGQSAGTNSVYARRSDGEAVQEIGFASWQASPDPADWFATDRLQVPITDVQAVKFNGFVLQKGDQGSWSLEGANPDGEVSNTKIKEFVAQLVQPTFDAVSKGGAPNDRQPVAGYSVATEDEEWRFDYYASDEPMVVRSGQDWRFQVSDEQLDAVTSAAPERFVASTGE
jgi:hypothetical protein